MNKLDGNSMNIVNENIEKLKEIFPEVFSEGKLIFEKLEEELGKFSDKENERYNFTWNGKSEAKKIAQTPSTGTLRPCKEESKNFDTTKNLYIEGDNLEVLKLLQKSYYKKVKMIYIDPPYNTGKDFVYKDNFKDNIKNYLEITGQVNSEGNRLSTNSDTSGRYHSDWLNMMYPRLKLARNLLKDDGVIFMSIDDNEVVNLRKLCDEIFGEDNFVGQIMVIVKTEGRQYGNFAKTHEYILVYAKSIESLNLNKIKSLKGEFKYFDNQGGFNTIGLRNRAVRIFNSTNRPNLRYSFYVNANQMDENGFFQVSVEKNDDWIEVFPSTVDGLESVWRWGKETAGKKINDLVALKGNDNEIRIFKKNRELTTLPKTVWFEKEFNSIVGTREIATLFGESYFDFPKPVKLLQQLLYIGSNENDIILDFFSGSATTAHAVMNLNSEDDSKRKFICVQLPESTKEKSEAFKAGYKNICEIGKERIIRAGEKVKTESGKDDLDIGFKVLKLDSSNIKSWDSDFENLQANLLDSIENIKLDRTNEDLLYEILLKYGLDLTLPIEELNINDKKVFNIGFGALIICLDSDIDTNTVEQIAQLKKQYEEDYGLEDMKVVFKDNGFKDAVVKTNSLQILKQHGINEVVSI